MMSDLPASNVNALPEVSDAYLLRGGSETHYAHQTEERKPGLFRWKKPSPARILMRRLTH